MFKLLALTHLNSAWNLQIGSKFHFRLIKSKMIILTFSFSKVEKTRGAIQFLLRSILISSFVSLIKACSTVSFFLTLPPGNSHKFSKTFPIGLLPISILFSSSITMSLILKPLFAIALLTSLLELKIF